MAKPKVRFTVNLTTELAEQVDAYAVDMGINRTSAVSVLLSTALSNRQMVSDMNKLLKVYEDIQKETQATE